jgi:hypothetical protein
MKHSVAHNLGKEKAQKVTRAAFEASVARFTEYGARCKWLSDDQAEIHFSAKGINLAGKVVVTERAIEIDMEVPFFFKPFQKLAVGRIDEEIHKWIGKAERGEVG